MADGDEKQFSHSEKRARIRQEIIDTEDTYVTHLDVLCAVYVAYLMKEKHNHKEYSVSEKDFDMMTSNIPTLTTMHNAFLKELRETDPVQIAGVLNKYADLFKMYTVYLNGYEACLQALSRLKNHKKGKLLMADIEKKLADAGHGLTLASYLIMPVQRIPRYVLLLAELLKASSENHPQYKNMVEAHEKVAKIAATINDAKRKMEAMSKLLEVAARISGVPPTFQIVLPYRRLIREGHLLVTMESSASSRASIKKTNRHIFLFNDYIVISKAEDPVWKGSITLSSATIEHKDGEADFSVTTAKMYMCFRCENEEERVAWITDISAQIEHLKRLRESKRSINARTKKSTLGHSSLDRDGSVHKLILGSLTHLKDDHKSGTLGHHGHHHSHHHGHSHHGSQSQQDQDQSQSHSEICDEHDHEHEGDDFDHTAPPEIHHEHDDHYHHDDE